MKTLKSEEAITILEDMKVNISIPKAAVTQIKRNAALNMAIDALLRCSEIPNDSDTISRQAAIDAADKIIERDTSGSNAVVNAMIAWSEYIRTLPSAQPEPETAYWIKPTGMMPPEHCGHYECSNCGQWAMRPWLKPRKGIELSDFCPGCGRKMLKNDVYANEWLGL